MMKKKYLILVFTILTAYNMNSQKKLSTLLTPSLNIIPKYDTKINGVEFSVAVNSEFLYIVTNDINFKIDNKPVIGRTLSSFKNKVDVTLRRGWGYTLKIDDYWYAFFKLGKLNDDSKVVCVFQYNYK